MIEAFYSRDETVTDSEGNFDIEVGSTNDKLDN